MKDSGWRTANAEQFSCTLRSRMLALDCLQRLCDRLRCVPGEPESGAELRRRSRARGSDIACLRRSRTTRSGTGRRSRRRRAQIRCWALRRHSCRRQQTFSSSPCPPGAPGLPDTCIRADVYRTRGPRSNALPTFFAQILDITSQEVRATATAQVHRAMPWSA